MARRVNSVVAGDLAKAAAEGRKSGPPAPREPSRLSVRDLHRMADSELENHDAHGCGCWLSASEKTASGALADDEFNLKPCETISLCIASSPINKSARKTMSENAPNSETCFLRVNFVFNDGQAAELLLLEDTAEALTNRILESDGNRDFEILRTDSAIIAVNVARLSYISPSFDNVVFIDLGTKQMDMNSTSPAPLRHDESEEIQATVQVILAGSNQVVNLDSDIELHHYRKTTIKDALISFDDRLQNESFVVVEDDDERRHYFRRSEVLMFGVNKEVLPDWA